MREILALASQVLRDPIEVVNRSEDREELTRITPLLLGIAVVGSMIFGTVVGSSRGGLQLVYAAVKMPVLMWIPVALSLPAARALWMACELEVSTARISLAGLVALARTAILAAAAGPMLWLFYSLSPGYHVSVLALAAALGLVGLPGLGVIARSMPAGGRRRWLAGAGSMLILGLCFAQTGWLLRPFVARPTAEISFLRPIEEDVFSALGATGRSAVGDYSTDWEPESRGLLRRSR